MRKYFLDAVLIKQLVLVISLVFLDLCYTSIAMSQVIDTSVVNMKVRELDGVIHGKDIAIAIPFDTP